MFKEENRIWWYMIGAVVMMFLLAYFGKEYVLPFIAGKKNINQLQPYVYTQAPAVTIDLSRDYYAKFHTSMGVITVDLAEDAAPINVNNIIFLANEGYYDGTKFHRLIKDFLIQGGDRNTLDDDPSNDGAGGPGYVIEDEVNWDALDLPQSKRTELSEKGYTARPGLPSIPLGRFTLAMAKDINYPNTNGSQFFFVLANINDPRLAQLNGYFTVIGKVTSGANVLDNISRLEVDNPTSPSPRPLQDIVLEKVEILTK
jgi:cyclophilin family peptidyl-prolyl cis-trans isomerase